MLEITIPIKPVPKGRPRFAKGRVFTPKKTQDAEKAIRDECALYCKEPIDGACRLTVVASGNMRPDLDNIIKLASDALNGIAYKDDRQIVELYGEKKKGEPFIYLKVEEC